MLLGEREGPICITFIVMQQREMIAKLRLNMHG